MKPTGKAVAREAIRIFTEEKPKYSQMDCQAFVEACVSGAGGSMAYPGSNGMARSAVWLGTLSEAKAAGKLVAGAGLLILEPTDEKLPAKYKGDGLGDFSHVGLYLGNATVLDYAKGAVTRRTCDVMHSSSSQGRVAGSTLANGWTHVMWFPEIEYGASVADDAGRADMESAPTEDAVYEPVVATVVAQSGSTVNLRARPSKGERLWWRVALGTEVTILGEKGAWSQISAHCTDGKRRTGWMMSEFLERGVG